MKDFNLSLNFLSYKLAFLVALKVEGVKGMKMYLYRRKMEKW